MIMINLFILENDRNTIPSDYAALNTDFNLMLPCCAQK